MWPVSNAISSLRQPDRAMTIKVVGLLISDN